MQPIEKFKTPVTFLMNPNVEGLQYIFDMKLVTRGGVTKDFNFYIHVCKRETITNVAIREKMNLINLSKKVSWGYSDNYASLSNARLASLEEARTVLA